jgi:hypothetical protein
MCKHSSITLKISESFGMYLYLMEHMDEADMVKFWERLEGENPLRCTT